MTTVLVCVFRGKDVERRLCISSIHWSVMMGRQSKRKL